MGSTWEGLRPYEDRLKQAVLEARGKRVVERIWAGDHTLWKESPVEIVNRLGWLNSPGEMISRVEEMERLVGELRREGYEQAVLLGMGGSSLAPEVLARVFGVRPGYLNLRVLDTTDPVCIADLTQTLDPQRTLFIAASKSGGTIETISALKYFYNWLAGSLPFDEVGRHFMVITDPDSSLAALAGEHRFRATLLNDPTIGGRYSALSYFGLFPGVLLGLDISLLLSRAMTQREKEESLSWERKNGALLGIILGELAQAGRNKVVLVLPEPLRAFADWIEQLLAESTGKEGRGILPVVGEELDYSSPCGDDRVFVVFRYKGEDPVAKNAPLSPGTGAPLIHLDLDDYYDLGKQFFLWEMAVAAACWRLGVNPFDQPDVEAAKVLAKEVLAGREGRLPISSGQEVGTEAGVNGEGTAEDVVTRRMWSQFFEGVKAEDYVAILAYLTPAKADGALRRIRRKMTEKKGVTVTMGYGPRYLHSTGQLHKGGFPGGHFLILTSDKNPDLAIPERMGEGNSSLTFGALQLAQARGDYLALRKAGRRVIHLHLAEEEVENLAAFIDEAI